MAHRSARARQVDFPRIREAARAIAPSLVPAMLPNGKRIAHEWLALNPRRSDKSLGSFKVNMFTGAWADFATGDYGGDIISLFGFIADCNAVEAAKMVADFVGISPWQGGR